MSKIFDSIVVSQEVKGKVDKELKKINNFYILKKLFKNFICFLGIHDWHYTRKSTRFRTFVSLKYRGCKNCGKCQYFTNLPTTTYYSPNKWKDL